MAPKTRLIAVNDFTVQWGVISNILCWSHSPTWVVVEEGVLEMDEASMSQIAASDRSEATTA